MQKKKLFFVLSVSAFAMLLQAKEYKLMDKGKAVSSIVISNAKCPVQKHAAEELAVFLAKIAGSKEKVAIGTKSMKGKYPVYLKEDKNIPVKAHGYILQADEKGLTVTGKDKNGVLYGAYAILKENTDIAWVFPGKEGEYYTKQPTITVKKGKKAVSPSFDVRTLSFHAQAVQGLYIDSWNWMVRNNLHGSAMLSMFTAKNRKKNCEEMTKRAFSPSVNPGFSNLLGGSMNWRIMEENLKKYWKEHPEYFPIINGKRTFLKGQAYQPCTTNADVIRLCAETLLESCIKPQYQAGFDGKTVIFNNDGTGWCQCENCKKLDTLRDKKMGYVSNRFWHFMNGMAAELAKKDQKAKIYGMGYQNFQAAPEMAIHPRIYGACLSYNRVCYRHKIDDPACLQNARFLSYYKDWDKKGIKLHGREEISTHGNYFQPAEETYVHLLKFYHTLKNFEGTYIAIATPDGWFSQKRKKSTVPIQWQSMWQTVYLHALYLWDINTDYAKAYEKMNSLYYGKGWEGGMREFRKLLNETAQNTPGCFGHGFSAPLGRLLDKPFVHERLKKYLADAEKAAALDPDPRALKHVLFDKKRFADTWERERKNYLENYRELRAYERTAPIKIDGVLDEKDWKNADIITNFRKNSSTSTLAEKQTFIRIVYEPEYFYFAAEMEEPTPGKIVREITKRDGPVWGDDTMELFLTHPDLGATFFHFIINANGAVYDRKVSPGEKSDEKFNSDILVKTRLLKDRWVIEGRIPTAQLGEKCFTGQSWKMNVMRVRKLIGSSGQGSTLTGGKPFDTGTFLSIAFSGKRHVSKHLQEADSRLWRNGTFNEPSPSKKPHPYFKKGAKRPSSWGFGSLGRKLTPSFVWEPVEKGSPNYTLKITNGKITNDLKAIAPRYKINYRVRGNGTLVFYVYRYGFTKRSCGSKILKTIKLADDKNWQNGKFEFDSVKTPDVKRQVFALHVSGECEIDELFLAPLQK